MKINTNPQKIKEVLTRGVAEVIDKNHLEKKLRSGRQLRIKLGVDPTSPNIRIGRAVPLLKLRDFQELGHKIVFIIGDFTGVIGDTSDKDSERPMLTEKEVGRNLKNYIQQAGKVIDIKKCEVRYNSEWLGRLGYNEIGRQANAFSLNEFISRENIKKRLNAGKRVSLRELLYPLMQGYDSVAIKADVEVGGTDQRFNLLAGRELQRYYNQEPQDIIINPLIEGPDGRKMSSSWGNVINITDSSREQLGKIMSIKDDLIVNYFELTTRAPLNEIKNLPPREVKMKLAKEIVAFYHNKTAALRAEKEFNRVFKDKKPPLKISAVSFKDKKINILDLLSAAKLAPSRLGAKRLVEQGGVKIGGQTITDWRREIDVKKDLVVQVGKRRFIKIA